MSDNVPAGGEPAMARSTFPIRSVERGLDGLGTRVAFVGYASALSKAREPPPVLLCEAAADPSATHLPMSQKLIGREPDILDDLPQ